MFVKTIKAHANDYGVRDGLPYEKNAGRIYEIADDAAAKNLIAAGLVEETNARDGEDRGAAGTGSGAKRAS